AAWERAPSTSQDPRPSVRPSRDRPPRCSPGGEPLRSPWQGLAAKEEGHKVTACSRANDCIDRSRPTAARRTDYATSVNHVVDVAGRWVVGTDPSTGGARQVAQVGAGIEETGVLVDELTSRQMTRSRMLKTLQVGFATVVDEDRCGADVVGVNAVDLQVVCGQRPVVDVFAGDRQGLTAIP